MNIKRIVITGGPGTGKSSIVKELEASGRNCLHEISREVILKAKEQGIDQLFLENPLLFSQMLLDGRLKQFHEADNYKESADGNLFYDRGLPDVVAYHNYANLPYPESFDTACTNHIYDKIFILPPWEEIYEQDNERYENFEESSKIYEYLKSTYQSYNYHLTEVPKLSIKERVRFILNNI